MKLFSALRVRALLCAGLLFAFGGVPRAEVPIAAVQNDPGDLLERIDREGDLAAPALVRAVAKLGTSDALEQLITVYERPHTRHPYRLIMVGALPLGAGENSYDDAAGVFLDGRVRAGRKARKDESAVELGVAAARALGEFGLGCVGPLADALEQPELLPARDAALEGLIASGSPIAESVARHVLEKASTPAGFKRISGASKAMDVLSAEVLANGLDEARVLELLEHRTNSGLRAVALEELAKRGSPVALERSRAALGEGWDAVGFRERLVAVQILLDEGEEEDWENVLRAGMQLGDGGRRLPGEGFGDRVAALVAANPKEQLSSLGSELLKAGDDEVLAYLVRALCTLETKGAGRIVQQAERSDSPLLRLILVDALSNVEDIEGLVDLAGLSKWELAERAAALEAASLLEREHPAVVEVASKYVNLSNGGELRGASLRALGRGQHTDLEPFEKALASDAPLERLSAVEGLVELRTIAAVDLLVGAIEHPDPRVAEFVSEALLELTGKSYGQNTRAWVLWSEDRPENWAPIDPEHAAYLTQVFKAREDSGTQAAEFFGIRIESERVVFVVDTSGSMTAPMRLTTGSGGSRRIDVVKSELISALRALSPETRYNVVTFSNGARAMHKKLVEANPKNVEQTTKKVAKLRADGGTNLFGGVVEVLKANELDTIVVLSDGAPTLGTFTRPADLERVLGALCRQRGVRLHAIAVGAQQNLLQRLAEATGGEYRRIQ